MCGFLTDMPKFPFAQATFPFAQATWEALDELQKSVLDFEVLVRFLTPWNYANYIFFDTFITERGNEFLIVSMYLMGFFLEMAICIANGNAAVMTLYFLEHDELIQQNRS